MEDVGMPCSVITSNGSPKHGFVKGEETISHARTSESKDTSSTRQESDWTQIGQTQSIQTLEVNNQGASEASIETLRKRKPSRPFSPNLDKRQNGCAKPRKSLKKTISSYGVEEVSPNNFKISENGQPVTCDNCHSPYAIDPTKRKKYIGKKLEKPKFRKRLDVVTNKILTLCNKCGLAMARISKRAPKKPLPTQEDKNNYFAEAEAFALSLAERLNEPEAKRLYCPYFKNEPCGCLQKYLKGKDDEDSGKIDERAFKLIDLLKTAKNLSCEKMHTTDSVAEGEKEEQIMCRGFGNRHSKVFEDFVLLHRVSLREELHLCERASQRVLMYSNNFLHKELKSMKNQRIVRKTGKFVKGLLKPIPDLPSSTCCNDQCVQLAVTHPKLLESWRLRAQDGQREARRVLAEMLTPCGGSKSNCYKFISLVTGCSLGTISSVNNYMRKTCGSRDPPEHGLKRWWRDNPKKRKNIITNKRQKSEEKVANFESTKMGNIDNNILSEQNPSPPSYETTLCSKDAAIQLQTQKEQLLELQKKVKIQQLQLQQQQQIIDQQLLQQNTHPNVTTSSSLQHTIQQLLLSPDIGAVTVLAAPKSLTEPMQVTAVEDMGKDSIMIAEAVESAQGMNMDNLHQMFRICQATSSANPDIMQNLQGEKELAEFSNDCSTLRPENERLINVQEMTSPAEVPSRQLLRLLEIPFSDPSSHTSVITSFSDKPQPQAVSVVSSTDIQPMTNVAIGVPRPGQCVRNVVILPESLMLDSALIMPKGITQSNTDIDSSLTYPSNVQMKPNMNFPAQSKKDEKYGEVSISFLPDLNSSVPTTTTTISDRIPDSTKNYHMCSTSESYDHNLVNTQGLKPN